MRTLRASGAALRAGGLSARDVARRSSRNRGSRATSRTGSRRKRLSARVTSCGSRYLGIHEPRGSLVMVLRRAAARGLASHAALASEQRTPRITIARLQYDGGGDWYANPSSLPNLLAAIRERTSLPVASTEARVTLMDDRLWDYPFIHMTGHGNVQFSDAEVVRLRDVSRARRLSARRRQLRARPELSARDRARLSRSTARRRAALAPDLSHRLRLSEGASEDPRARRQAGAGLRHFHRRPTRRVLQLLERSRKRLGRHRGLSRSAGAARGGAAHGRESLRLRRDEPPAFVTLRQLVARERFRLVAAMGARGAAFSLAAAAVLAGLAAFWLGDARWISEPAAPAIAWVLVLGAVGVPLVWTMRARASRRDAGQGRARDRARALAARWLVARRARGGGPGRVRQARRRCARRIARATSRRARARDAAWRGDHRARARW